MFEKMSAVFVVNFWFPASSGGFRVSRKNKIETSITLIYKSNCIKRIFTTKSDPQFCVKVIHDMLKSLIQCNQYVIPETQFHSPESFCVTL